MPVILEGELDRLNGLDAIHKSIEKTMVEVVPQMERFESAWARLQDPVYKAANPQEAQKAMAYGNK